MSEDVRRLPVQHKRNPHCAQCKEPLPTYDDLAITTREDERVHITHIQVRLHVTCSCGAKWVLLKECDWSK